MSRTDLPTGIYDYLIDHGVREHDALRGLREATLQVEMNQMQIGPDQGAFMALLVQLLGAEKTLEIGTYTGYSALAVALALPDHGRVIACDISDEWTRVGRPFWAQAGVAHKIDLRLAPALETLDALLASGQAGTFDFAFIDADKERYVDYYERCLQLLRPGGLVALDNVLWSGRVADPSEQGESTVALRAVNDRVRHDERVTICMVPIGDGLTLARKR